MPSYIVKPKPDEDFYVIYSTVVDNVTDFGSRETLEAFSRASEPSRFDRADANGTSSLWGDPPYLGWGAQKVFISGEGLEDPTKPEESGFGYIDRADLRAYCETLDDEGVFRPTPGMIRWEPEDDG